MRVLLLSLPLLIAAVLAGCDSSGIVIPAGPEAVSVHLQGAFNDDRVVVELDGDRVFSNRVTTNVALSLAEQVPLSILAGDHSIRVVVNGRTSAAREFTAGTVSVIGVRYNPGEGDITLYLYPLGEEPLYF